MLKMTSSSDFSGITMMSYLADPGSKPRVVAQVEEYEITYLGSNPGALCLSFLQFNFDLKL